MTRSVVIALLFVFLTSTGGSAQEFQPTWESLNRRALPTWFNEAKFGIFVVWGPYSSRTIAGDDAEGFMATSSKVSMAAATHARRAPVAGRPRHGAQLRLQPR